MKPLSFVLIFTLIGAVISGCSTPKSKEALDSPREIPDYYLIAENLVNVLGSLNSISHFNTTFQMLSPTTPIGKAVFETVEDQGYGIQIVTGDLGNNFLRYKAELSQTENGLLEVYTLSVANHSVQRQYAVLDGRTVPTSAVTVRTDSVIESDLDDSLFGVLLERSVSSVIEINANIANVMVFNEIERSPTERDSELFVLANVRNLERSNFQSTFEKYENVSQQTLTFANDSLVLGNGNKNRLNQLVAQIQPETDIVSVIGCSHGSTQYENGNQLLAEGRAQRVTESLMFAGLNPDLIFDEACWAADYWDEKAPRRGVMVTHKRLKKNG